MAFHALIAVSLAAIAPVPAETCVAAPAAGYAGIGTTGWYINNDPVTIAGRKFTKYGLPRVLSKGDVVPFKSYQGGHFYAEPGTPQPEVIYLLVRLADCEFQPYAVEG
ncbi:hypothetical protein ACFQ1E_06960 [Sphingomonas canadensis]|uniref:Uncharacterized protein n=1 Tax=Sphingomonas canadensis TaxID=1219257 RepID=A0ABW3H8S9_9SPHN|nr:hypothetical protein [Sphingomonas canadensis]MCW3835472.1 hypothetical protein [Sphingomonas canadensis]